MNSTFKKASFYSVPKRELFAFHERKDAFSLLTPASFNIDVESTVSTLRPSAETARFITHFMGLKFGFEMAHTVYEPPDLFVDEQRQGLFTSWKHYHRFTQAGWEGDPASMMTDEIVYAHPLLAAINPFVQQRLGKLFAYRHQVTGRHVHMPHANRTTKRRIVVTGATGLIGKRVTEILLEKGDEVVAFARNTQKAKKLLGPNVTVVKWDFEQPQEQAWKQSLEHADGVIHLAGTPLFQQRWTASFKQKMEQSRVQGTRQLIDAIAQAPRQPRCFISASAVGIYGMDHQQTVDESAPSADDLLARICVNWEEEAQKLEEQQLRTVQVRIGIVLSRESGILKALYPLFQTGLGGLMGLPTPHINWIHLEDVSRIIVMGLDNEQMSGPYNAVAPNPVQNAEFSTTLAKVLKRPKLATYPPGLLNIMIGEAGQYASGGPKVSCGKVQQAGYRFFFDTLEPAMNHALKG